MASPINYIPAAHVNQNSTIDSHTPVTKDLSGLKLVSFNCNGLHNRLERNALLSHFRLTNYDIIGLQETHILDNNVLTEIASQWDGPVHISFGTGRGKGLITLFHKKFESLGISEVFKTDRLLVSTFELGEEKVILVNVYAPSENNEKAPFFNNLSSFLNDNIPNLNRDHIVLLGDMNIAMTKQDVICGAQHSERIRRSLRNFCDRVGLTDTYRILHPDKNTFTWDRGKTHWILRSARRLDYIFLTEGLTPYLKSCNIRNFGFSDHRAVIVELKFSTFKKGKGLYKLNTSLLSDSMYCSTIKKEIATTLEDYKDLNPHLVWEMVKTNIIETTQQYSKYKARDTRLEQSRARTKLAELEDLYAIYPNDHNLADQIYKLRNQIEVAEVSRAKGAQIRARVKFVEDGELNTDFFLGMEKTLSESSTIKQLTLPSGILTKNEHEVLDEISSKFEERYNKTSENLLNVSLQMDAYTKSLTLPRLAEADRQMCDNTLNTDDITEAVRHLNKNSAPGADGLPSEFYQVFWEQLKSPLLNSYYYSLETGSLSHSQKLGVISLHHKGKDLRRDDLNNWRPLSLLNVDQKILSKALSLRIDKVINKLIGDQQLGFLKGRDITAVHRRIDDILELQKSSNRKGFVTALDFKQAFDAINMNCVMKSLDLFGFGSTFKRWIEILNHDRRACIKNGGHISDPFPMSNGVRQGCVISPQLFLLAVEILAQKIIQDDSIKGLNPHQADKPTKVNQLADDTTLFQKNKRDVARCLKHLQKFSKFSGLFLNLNKCFALSTNGTHTELQEFNIQIKDSVKILGIIYSTSVSACENELNWLPKIDRIRKILTRNYKRKLTILGRIHIIKTDCLSQLVYVMRSISIPTAVLQVVNKLFFEFIWKGKPDAKKSIDRIKRNVMCNDISQGGLKMINIVSFQESILIEWAVALLTNIGSYWTTLASYFFQGLGGLSVFRCKLNKVDEIRNLESVASPFWRGVLKCWHQHSDQISAGLSKEDPLFNNKLIKYKSKPLFFPLCIQKSIRTIKDMYYRGQLISFNTFSEKCGRHPSSFICYYAIATALKNSTYSAEHNPSPTTYFKGHKLHTLNRRAIYNLIKPKELPLCVSKWERKFNITTMPAHWQLIASLKEWRLRILSWKIMHDIYPSGVTLQKLKIRSTNICPHCLDSKIDTLEHFFVDCAAVIPLWKEIRALILINTGSLVNLSHEVVLISVKLIPNMTRSKLSQINHIIAIGKYCISKFKSRSKLKLLELLERELSIRKVWQNDC